MTGIGVTTVLTLVIASVYRVQSLQPINLQTPQNANSIPTEPPGLISKEIFNIQTPDYPLAFKDKTNLGWKVSKSDFKVCYMSFIIKELELATTSCDDAYLSIGEHKFCRTMLNERLEVRVANNPLEVVKVEFYVSKKSRLGNKFSVMAIQHPETCVGPIQLKPVTGCNTEFKAHDGIFGKSKYLNNTLNYPENECVLTFKRSSSHCGIKFNFLSFDFGSNCDLDYIIFDGKRYCGQQLLHETRVTPYPKDAFKDITVTVNIGSKDFYGEGFVATYIRIQNDCPIDCSEKYLNSSFTLTSPVGDMYPNSLDCEYTILKEKSDIKCLMIDVKNINLDSSRNLCSDYLQLFNHKKICNMSQIPSKTYKVAFPVRKNYLKVWFHTDKSGTGSSFAIDIKQLSENCPEDVCQNIDSSAVMESPEYPEKVPKNVRCKYAIARELDRPMKLTMFKISYNLAGKLIVSTPGRNIFKDIFDRNDIYALSLYNAIELPFKSFFSSEPGFQIFLHQTPVKFKICDENEDNSKIQGVFRTPGYNFPKYDKNQSCMMSITRYSSDICKVKLSVHKFELAPRNNITGECMDYIDWSREGKKCGSITETKFGSVEIPFTQGQKKIFIKFFSDAIADDNGKGVEFFYQQSSQNC